MKKAIISGIVSCSILLCGCNSTKVLESEKEVVVSQRNGGNAGINLISELKNEIIVSVTEQTELDSDSLAIMADGGTDELTVSVGFPKDSKIDDKLIQKIVEESIKTVTETEKVTSSEEKVKIKIRIEKY